MDTACREYQGTLNNHGYGIRRSGRGPFGTDYVHRQVWIMLHGPIPAGQVLLHACDNPACFRIDHLAIGTQADNAGDMAAKGRGRNQNSDRTECRRGHAFTPDNTYVDATGRRHCRTCARDWAVERSRSLGTAPRIGGRYSEKKIL